MENLCGFANHEMSNEKKQKGWLYERSWLTSRSYQNSDRSFIWLHKMVNSCINNKTLNYMSTDKLTYENWRWFASPDLTSSPTWNMSEPQGSYKKVENLI